jgi:hypothetical protein
MHVLLNPKEELRSDSSGESVCGDCRSHPQVQHAAARFDAIASLLPELFLYHWQATGEFFVAGIKIAPTYGFIKVKFALEQAMKAQRGDRGIALLFL